MPELKDTAFVRFLNQIPQWSMPAVGGSYSLEGIAFFNSIGGTGAIPGYPQDMFSITKIDEYTHMYLSKYKYTGYEDYFDPQIFENFLFKKGRLAFVKLNGEIVMGIPTPKKWTENNEPTHFTLTTINQGEPTEAVPLSRTFEVGRDGVIIQSGTPWWIGDKVYFSPWLKVLAQVQRLRLVHDAIMLNVVTSGSRLTLPADTSDDNVKSVNSELAKPNALAIRLGHSALGSPSLRSGNNMVQQWEDRTVNLWINFNNIEDIIHVLIGMNTNPSPDKKVHQTDTEIASNNEKTRNINETELTYRKKGIEVFNKVFGSSITVELRYPPEAEVMQPEGVENGKPRQETGQ